MMALCDWFKRKSAPKPRSRPRTRDVVIVSEVPAAELPNKSLAAESKREQTNFIQAILNMERKAAHLNTTLAELTLKNFNGGRS
ncbi:hypothetical protein G6L26_009760 [Agrobacterium radiobacter]|uniref:hypothetical protein n=1 Tax=Agrobacterium tumefaciens complex TaxID=1183400 RepID=UPI00114683B9|nr:hypothetical protein [Agrobacterium tumefaciens]NTA05471.1 hypothetical protein [Agrobacterium tumefaciens]NTA92064.1 hypothetical protein [Agrobacterium tumefaciens]